MSDLNSTNDNNHSEYEYKTTFSLNGNSLIKVNYIIDNSRNRPNVADTYIEQESGDFHVNISELEDSSKISLNMLEGIRKKEAFYVLASAGANHIDTSDFRSIVDSSKYPEILDTSFINEIKDFTNADNHKDTISVVTGINEKLSGFINSIKDGSSEAEALVNQYLTNFLKEKTTKYNETNGEDFVAGSIVEFMLDNYIDIDDISDEDSRLLAIMLLNNMHPVEEDEDDRNIFEIGIDALTDFFSDVSNGFNFIVENPELALAVAYLTGKNAVEKIQNIKTNVEDAQEAILDYVADYYEQNLYEKHPILGKTFGVLYKNGKAIVYSVKAGTLDVVETYADGTVGYFATVTLYALAEATGSETIHTMADDTREAVAKDQVSSWLYSKNIDNEILQGDICVTVRDISKDSTKKIVKIAIKAKTGEIVEAVITAPLEYGDDVERVFANEQLSDGEAIALGTEYAALGFTVNVGNAGMSDDSISQNTVMTAAENTAKAYMEYQEKCWTGEFSGGFDDYLVQSGKAMEIVEETLSAGTNAALGDSAKDFNDTTEKVSKVLKYGAKAVGEDEDNIKIESAGDIFVANAENVSRTINNAINN